MYSSRSTSCTLTLHVHLHSVVKIIHLALDDKHEDDDDKEDTKIDEEQLDDHFGSIAVQAPPKTQAPQRAGLEAAAFGEAVDDSSDDEDGRVGGSQQRRASETAVVEAI
jgi:hypothetical protein